MYGVALYVWYSSVCMVGPVYSLRELAHVAGGLDLYYADPAQPRTTAREELDYLDHDISFRG